MRGLGLLAACTYSRVSPPLHTRASSADALLDRHSALDSPEQCLAQWCPRLGRMTHSSVLQMAQKLQQLELWGCGLAEICNFRTLRAQQPLLSLLGP